MITIISGTNREGSQTLKVAKLYKNIFELQGIAVQLLDLATFDATKKDEAFMTVHNAVLVPTEKFVVIAPEYNGSFPGILKLLMDNTDVKNVWWHKKVMLVGVAEGRAGNLRGLDHLTNIFNYLKVTVLPNKIPLSKISSELDNEGNFAHEATKTSVTQQVQEFIKL